jgi:hypothetical protein
VKSEKVRRFMNAVELQEKILGIKILDFDWPHQGSLETLRLSILMWLDWLPSNQLWNHPLRMSNWNKSECRSVFWIVIKDSSSQVLDAEECKKECWQAESDRFMNSEMYGKTFWLVSEYFENWHQNTRW